MSYKNNLILFFLKILKKNKKTFFTFNPSHPKILVVSTTALGDSLWATPTIQSIKQTYKNSFLACLCSSASFEVFKDNPYIDKLFTLKKPFLWSFLSFYQRLKKEQFQAILILHASQRFILPLCSLLNASTIAATKGINKGLDILLTHPLEKQAVHEIDRRFEIANTIGVEKKTTKMSFYFKEERLLLLDKIKKPFIVFHPGGKDSFRLWPASSYIALGKMLHNHYQNSLAINGITKEKILIDTISSNIPNSFNLCGKLNLAQLATLLKRADLLIVGDTGPLHLACALKVKVIALFAASKAEEFGPYNVDTATVIAKKILCQPCLKRKCQNPKCFLQITPKEVFETCQTILKR